MQRQFDDILSGCLSSLPEESASGGVLLAVSGGIDSMCMASLFLESRECLKFAVCHCNFHLRGEESDGDEALVRDWCERQGTVFHKKDFDTLRFASERGLSEEMAARELRYTWFADLCSLHGYRSVAVAHNANDNAETLFLNMLRGTGIRGLVGMRHVSALPYSEGRFHVIRPMLDFTRRQIEGYVLANRIMYRNDRTNAGTEFRRNRIRNIVFPVFDTINPSFIKTVNREMSYFSQVAGIADEYLQKNLPYVMSGHDDGCSVDIAKLKELAYWEYVLYEVMSRYGFNASVVEDLAALLNSDNSTVSGKYFFSQDYELLTSTSVLQIRRKPADRPILKHMIMPGVKSLRDTTSVVVRCGGKYEFNGIKFTVREIQWNVGMQMKTPPGTVMFDKAAVNFPFICRKWIAGDWFVPSGMKGKKKISDLFTDLKYSIEQKEKAVMVVAAANEGQDQGHVAALLGVRIDDGGEGDRQDGDSDSRRNGPD